MRYLFVLLVMLAGCSDPSIAPPLFSRGDVVTVVPITTPSAPKPSGSGLVEPLPAKTLGIIRSVSKDDNKWRYVVMFPNDDIAYYEAELRLHHKAVWSLSPGVAEVSEPVFP
jgi:hypothetical protein